MYLYKQPFHQSVLTPFKVILEMGGQSMRFEAFIKFFSSTELLFTLQEL